ncbi:MAG TPA: phosphatase PAP2 family protein [Chloroflexota bacterium]|nr:phosphatase PAP2 family protein [Chloroflexota bacterium]
MNGWPRLVWAAVVRSVPLALIPAVAFAIVAVLDRLPAVGRWNDGISVWLQGPEELPLTVTGFLTDWLFSGQLSLAVALIVCIIFAVKRQWFLALSAATIFPLVAVEGFLKVIIHQPPASGFLQTRVLPLTSDLKLRAIEHGFPSGHSARLAFIVGWVALLLVPARYRWPVAAALLILALFMAWTRIYVGDHSLLEVVAGLLLAGVFLPASWALALLAKQRPAR